MIEIENYGTRTPPGSSYVRDQRANGSGTSIKNSDGLYPDTGEWDYASVRNREPAHEFTHLQGPGNQGTSGTDLTQSPGGVFPTPSRMTQNDFDTVIGKDARSDRDGYLKLRTNVPGVYPAVNTFHHVKWCCR